VDQARWLPSADVIAAANLSHAMRERGLATYDEFYAWSAADRAGFWGYTVERLGIVLGRQPQSVLAGTPQHPRWLPGARFNIVDSCFAADPGSAAIVYARDGALHRVTYGELHQQVGRFANGLASLGVRRGDRVAIAMPMNVEAVIAYLGIVAVGGVVVSIADSFAPAEIATRLRIADAATVVTQDVIHRTGRVLPMYAKVVAAGAARAIVVTTGVDLALRDHDVAWADVLSDET
jgi:acetyl-CoA synthetase